MAELRLVFPLYPVHREDQGPPSKFSLAPLHVWLEPQSAIVEAVGSSDISSTVDTVSSLVCYNFLYPGYADSLIAHWLGYSPT